MNKVKLFCFPNAGSSAMIYVRWRRLLNQDIELIPVEYPGHGGRMREPFCNNMDELIEDVMKQITQSIDTTSQYAFFGHSMGSAIAYELYYRLTSLGYQAPLHIFLSGREAPTAVEKKDSHYLLPEDAFRQHLLELGGITNEIFENKELCNVVMPIVRSDYRILGLFSYKIKEEKMTSDISILNGKDDSVVMKNEVNGWALTTEGKIDFYYFEGGHFYINDCWIQINDIINSKLGR